MNKEPTRSCISSKSRGIDYYLDLIGDDFKSIEVFSTAGDIRPPYPFQWLARSKVMKGSDDGCEGIGNSPLKAVQNLYKEMKKYYE
jgi:hypothetical protein